MEEKLEERNGIEPPRENKDEVMSPDVDESRSRLTRAGWSVADTAHGRAGLVVWLVTGGNGENRVNASGTTQAEAWWNACVCARECGMLARAIP